MLRLALILALSSPPTPAFALTISLESTKQLNAQDLAVRCADSKNTPRQCKNTAALAPIEERALDTCLSFQSEEDKIPGDNDQSQAEIASTRVTRSRFDQCLQKTKKRAFNGKALTVCSLAHDFVQHLQCLDTIADNPYMEEAVKICQKKMGHSGTAGLDCLAVTAGQAYSAAALQRCGQDLPAISRTPCLHKDNNPLRQCELRVSAVQSEVQSMVRAASGSRSQKEQLQNILDILQKQEVGTERSGQ